MSRKEDIFRYVLTNSYDHSNFVDFAREIISGLNVGAYNIEMKPYNTFSAYISRYFMVGDFSDTEGNSVGVFSVELLRGESVERARTAQRNFVKSILENGSYSSALVAFYSPDNDKWRFSFVRMDYEFAKGKIKESLTPARRYSYLVGKGEPCHTAMDRLLPIFMDDAKLPTIDEIEEAFSVEKVTKDFFEAYKNKYLQLAEYLENNEDFVRESSLKGFTTEQFTKKLLSQIVFLYFIQKKGWLGVNAVPKVLTEKEYKNAFFSHGRMSRELVGQVYYQDGDVYRLNGKALQALSDEDETEFSKCVKGQPWGTGPKNFMRKIFENAVKHGENFFDDCLEPLFYTGLNRDRGENAFFPPLHCRIPFLNGGLFEELDHYDWQYNDFAIPNEIFSNAAEKGRDADGILDIFDRYNFTMAEDEPLEKEVAVDPEMLGKVFENLLEVKDKKSKGAFYTPREIVHYMCSESLINYLTTKSGIPENDIRKFITLGEFFKDEDARRTKYNPNTKKYEYDYNKQLEIPATILDYRNNVNRLDELDTYLSTVRVVDPAVGSGAFPLGLLNEIVKARTTLTTYMAIPMDAFHRKMLYAQRQQYQLKTQTIKNCIFACDVEPSATDITKLRLWLSLVIDDEIGEQDRKDVIEEHTKPMKLPNLECNILCGNSLVDSFGGVRLICNTEALGNQVAGTQVSIADRAIQGHLNSLIELQDQLYNADTVERKQDIKHNIQLLYDAIIHEQLQNRPDLMRKYVAPEVRNAASKPFIIWQLYFPKVFKDNGGFDICIGNPPYLESRSPFFSEEFKNILQESIKERYGKNADWIPRGADLLIYFFELSLRLINKNGINTFITQNSWLATEFGKKFQDYLINNTNVLAIVDSDYKYFETADINTVITFFKGTQKQSTPVLFARCHENLKNYAVPASSASPLDKDAVTYKVFPADSKTLREMKWGFIFDTDEKLLSIIDRINKLGKTIDQIPGYSIGQGLNLKKSAVFTEALLGSYGIQKADAIPFFVTEESGVYNWTNTGHFIVEKQGLSEAQKEAIGKDRDLFDKGKTTKVPPTLIMPRGIGARHFCCFNTIGGFSASCVDLYSPRGNVITNDTIRLWLYLNSSVFWLIREIVGRTNLGGGMLKAEAVDIKPFSILFPIEITDHIMELFEDASKVTVKNAQEEIFEPIHQEIDRIVFDTLHLNSDEREYICDLLTRKINGRYAKTKAK